RRNQPRKTTRAHRHPTHIPSNDHCHGLRSGDTGHNPPVTNTRHHPRGAAMTTRHHTTTHSADGTPIHIETIGPENAPTIVLAHGWTCATPFWAPVVNHLPDDLRIVLYDQ